jgi:hypothetical protein
MYVCMYACQNISFLLLSKVTRWVCAKNRLKCSQTHFCENKCTTCRHRLKFFCHFCNFRKTAQRKQPSKRRKFCPVCHPVVEAQLMLWSITWTTGIREPDFARTRLCKNETLQERDFARTRLCKNETLQERDFGQFRESLKRNLKRPFMLRWLFWVLNKWNLSQNG